MTRANCQNPDACTAAKPTTHCRRCAAIAINACPIIAERRKQAIRAKYDDPDFRERHAAAARKNIAIVHQRKEWMREQGKRLHQHSRAPEALAKRKALYVQSGQRRTATLLPWCPPAYLDLHRFFVKVKGFTAAESRQMVEAQIAIDSDHSRTRNRVFNRLYRAKAVQI